MNSSVPLALVLIGLLVFLSHLFSSFFSKKKVPDVLLLILVGLILGPITGIISLQHFGKVGSVFTTVTLVIILFEGGTSLSVSTLKKVWKSTMNLTVISFFVLMGAIALISYLFMDFSVLASITLGAILGGTSSAVVIPIVGKLTIGDETKTVLILESALTDVFSIVLALACVQAFSSGSINIGATIGSVISSFVLATIIGIAGALLWSRILTKIRNIQNSIFTTPAFVFIIYGLSELLGFNGAIATLAFGISMANLEVFTGFFMRKIMGGEPHKLNRKELIFLKEIAFLLKTFFFVYIGISIIYDDITSLLIGASFTFILYIIRLFISKYFSPTSASIMDKSIISMISPKGLAAAVLATIPAMVGMPEGNIIKNIVYAVVFFSILLTSVLIIGNNKYEWLRKFYTAFFNKKFRILNKKKSTKL